MFSFFNKKPKLRQVIMHYHLFKNAGTTFDFILKKNLGTSWGSIEGAPGAHRLKNEELLNYIYSNHNLLAVSSHEARPPMPMVEDLKVFSVLFLRHPIDRIGSIYSYRRKLSKNPTRSTQVAKDSSFKDYLRWCFDNPSAETVINFHVNFLSQPAVGKPLLERYKVAIQTLKEVSFFGFVEYFDKSLDIIRKKEKGIFANFDFTYTVQNKSEDRMSTIEERLRNIETLLGNSLYQEALERNALDIQLYDTALKEFNEITR